MKELPDFYLEQVEKALRGDLRFKYLIDEDSETTMWNLLVLLSKNNLYFSYLSDDMDYKI